MYTLNCVKKTTLLNKKRGASLKFLKDPTLGNAPIHLLKSRLEKAARLYYDVV